MTSDPWDAIDGEFPVDQVSVYYRIPEVTIDTTVELAIGSEVGLRVLAVVAPADSAASDSCGDRVPTASLRIVDWLGPWLEPHNPTEPPVIAEHILDAAARGIEAAAKRSDPAATDPELSREFARVAIEAVARRVSPTNDEATAMLVGVLRLDVEKLRRAGDALATLLRGRVSVDGNEVEEELAALARWKGDAHDDWAEYQARGYRVAGPATTSAREPLPRPPGDDVVVELRLRRTGLAELERGVTLGIDQLTGRPIEQRLVKAPDGIYDLEVVTNMLAMLATTDPVAVEEVDYPDA